MRKHVPVLMAVALFVLIGGAMGVSGTGSRLAALEPQQSQAGGGAAQPPNMMMTPQQMMTMHQQMMSDMKAADAKLDQLVNEMNSATGDAKVAAIAKAVTELVNQQKGMHVRIGSMYEQMMNGQNMMMGGQGTMMKR